MDNKQIQEERIKGYFLEAAKNLLKGEGLKSISVRHVAHKAGYSYATLYNYFKDLNELIFYCVKDFQQEAEDFINRKAGKAKPGKERIKATAKAYMEYFIEYPGVFELFFLERMGDIGNKEETSALIYSFLDKLCEEDWKACVADGTVKAAKAETLKTMLRSVTAGMLLYYENRLQPDNYKDFIKQADEQLNEILD